MRSTVAAIRNSVNGPDKAVAEIAGRQHGIVTVRDLRAAGLSPSGVSRRVARGHLHRIHPRVYAVGHTALSREARCLAAVLAAGDGAALNRLAAAELWMVSRFRNAPISVVAARQVRIKGVRVHRCTRLDPRDVTRHRDIPVTTVARTIVDLAEIRTAQQVANVMYEAAFRDLLDLDAVEETAARLLGRHGTRTLEEALDMHRKGSAGTKSAKEDAFLALVDAKPIVNVKVLGEEVDAYWPEHRLIVEVDGPGHERPRARRWDAQRDRKLRAAGYTVIRVTDKDPPDAVRARVQAAMKGVPT